MIYLNGILLVFFETLFVFVTLALLYNQRRVIGRAPFSMTLGMLLLFYYLTRAADCRVLLPGEFDFEISGIAVYMPLLAALLMVYINEGTLETQRLIIGFAVLYGLYLYVGEVTRVQSNWVGITYNGKVSASALDELIARSREVANVLAAANLLDFFVAPIVYSGLSALHLARFFGILGGLAAAFLGEVMVVAGICWLFELPLQVFDGGLIARLAAVFLLAFLLWGYLALLEKTRPLQRSGTLELLFAFFGSYGRSKQLEMNLREWTERHRLVLENAGELIVTMTPAGKILDANYAAARLLGAASPAELIGTLLLPRLSIMLPSEYQPGSSPDKPRRFRCLIDGNSSHATVCDCSISPLEIGRRRLLVLIGRDITEETKLAEAREKLSNHMAHVQRIESLGMLAGGIAHDFNNFIHAILGHADVITMLHHPTDPDVNRHLEKITAIAEQAGRLTNQLLGFARKGKYQVVELSLPEVIEASLSLLGPQKKRGVELSVRSDRNIAGIRGDSVQMQQVMLNLLLNAIDAMSENAGEKRIRIAAANAEDASSPFAPPPERAGAERSKFVCLEVTDNGSGMDKSVQEHIFEPFFTTKPVGSGTGMGLAMVYGTVSNHNGWIQVRSAPGCGTSFYIYLPKSLEKNGENTIITDITPPMEEKNE
ncbi:MAG: ATP-binding protein [Victivallaceae bacterium]|nr:ATP-binding protein [Victivallaceae bacterium]